MGVGIASSLYGWLDSLTGHRVSPNSDDEGLLKAAQMFEVVDGERYYCKPLDREIWRFFIRSEHGPVGVLQVDAQTGAVIRLTNADLRAVREKAAILAARRQGVFPLDLHGYVLAEDAPRRDSSYLDEQLSMFYGGTDPVFSGARLIVSLPVRPWCWSTSA